MTIILFLVDTSASMNHKTYLGLVSLDVAKTAIEQFLKLRSKDPESRMDRYMLMSFEDPPFHIKAGWKENHAVFMNELKNLRATGLTNLGASLKRAFDLLNVNRAYSGIDMHGQGRYPNYIEPAMIICFTDGQRLTSATGSDSELQLPGASTVPGNDLTKEPFRWDQRLYSVIIQYPAITPASLTENIADQIRNIPSATGCPIQPMCDITGGRTFVVNSHLMMGACLDQLSHKLHHGVIVNFEKLEDSDSMPTIPVDVVPMDADNSNNSNSNSSNKVAVKISTEGWQRCKSLVYVKRSATAQRGFAESHWPLPESFWTDASNTLLPPRNAQPNIIFSNRPVEPMVIENFPFDKYEIEPCALTQYILDNVQPNLCWQLYVENSCKHSASKLGEPFGYLKASTQLNCVNLFVHPYNYPAALRLVDELIRRHALKPTRDWQMQFDRYLWTMPAYYAAAWRKALSRIGASPTLVPEQLENCNIHSSVLAYLKKIKQTGKERFEEIAATVAKTLATPTPRPLVKIHSRTANSSIVLHPQLNVLPDHPSYKPLSVTQVINDVFLAGGGGFLRQSSDNDPNRPPVHKNPFAIGQHEIKEKIALLRQSLLRKAPVERAYILSTDLVHRLPISQMGNYQTYLERQTPALRELEPTSQRVNTFGNPFKTNKNMMVDEADEAVFNRNSASGRTRSLSTSSSSSTGSGRGRRGPLAKDYVFVPARKRQRNDSTSSMLSSPGTPGSSMMSPPSSPASLRSPFSPLSDSSDSIDLTNDADAISHGSTSSGGLTAAQAQHLASLHDKQSESLGFIRREIRRPGRDHKALFDHLRELEQGFDQIYTIMLKEACFEARRLKRFSLADELFATIEAVENSQRALLEAQLDDSDSEENKSSACNKINGSVKRSPTGDDEDDPVLLIDDES